MPIRRALLSACCVLLLSGGVAHALPLPPEQLLARNEQISLGEAAERVRKQTGGRILGAEVVHDGDWTYYVIRVLVQKGKVKVYRVDPASGAIF